MDKPKLKYKSPIIYKNIPDITDNLKKFLSPNLKSAYIKKDNDQEYIKKDPLLNNLSSASVEFRNKSWDEIDNILYSSNNESKNNYFKKTKGLRKAMKDKGLSSLAIYNMMKQAAIESSWGKSELADNHNYFGIKSFNNGEEFDTIEFVDGKETKTKSKFKKYNTEDDAIDDYLSTINKWTTNKGYDINNLDINSFLRLLSTPEKYSKGTFYGAYHTRPYKDYVDNAKMSLFDNNRNIYGGSLDKLINNFYNINNTKETYTDKNIQNKLSSLMNSNILPKRYISET